MASQVSIYQFSKHLQVGNQDLKWNLPDIKGVNSERM